jgi:hypothetical protein
MPTRKDQSPPDLRFFKHADRAIPFLARIAYAQPKGGVRSRKQINYPGRLIVSHRSSSCALALVVALSVTIADALADDMKYPNWKGEWVIVNPRVGGQRVRFDPSKRFGPAQQAPLTPEYQKILEDSMADQVKGGQGNFVGHALCLPPGMPTVMAAAEQEYIITPETTYISLSDDFRRIFTDGRPWPTNLEPTFNGYSIGKWIDEDGDGVYDVLEADTRGPFKGPRAYDASGLPLHFDNESTFKERFFIDKADLNILHDVITVFDHALTRPWTADKQFRRSSKKFPNWNRTACIEGNNYVLIGNEVYFLGAGGLLMPAKKDQAPPDLRHFKQSRK